MTDKDRQHITCYLALKRMKARTKEIQRQLTHYEESHIKLSTPYGASAPSWKLLQRCDCERN